MKRVTPRFLEELRLERSAVNDFRTWAYYGWVIEVDYRTSIFIGPPSGTSKPVYLSIYGQKYANGGWRKTKEIRIFLKQINEEIITNALMETEKGVSELK